MEAIYDSSGRAVGWRKRDAVLDREGRPRAFVRDRNVFAFSGAYLGRFEDGFYRDKRGAAVAFEKGATGGPLPPVTQPEPIQPPPVDIPSLPRETEPAEPPRFRSMTWSEVPWEAFLGCESQVKG